jgi:restriction system protein
MAIPDFQSFLLPVLKIAGDNQEHTKQALLSRIAKELDLSADDLEIKLPSGKQSTFNNRVSWAKTFLKQAGLLEYPHRGAFKITARGQSVLAENPLALDVKYLKRFSEFVAFQSGGQKDKITSETVGEVSDTPDELMAVGYKQMREALAIDLLDRIKSVSPSRFEELVVELLVKMGYGGTQEDAGARVTGKSGDGGIDGIINEDRLGLDVIYIQAKRWEADVGRPEIQKFVGALAGHKANKGVFITSSGFTKGATDYASQVNHRVVLIDGPMLAELMMDHDLGVSTKDVYTVKRLDTDYFEED